MNYLKKLEDEVSAWPNGELGVIDLSSTERRNGLSGVRPQEKRPDP
jgi:hypothetical protein